MTAKAIFTETQARLIWDTVKLLRSSGLLRNVSRLARPDDPGPYPVFVKNISGESIPPFACMQVDGTEDVDEITYVKVDKPSSTDGQYLFNGESEIEASGYGMSYPWGVVKMLTDGTITPNGIYGPTVDAWTIEESAGGPFVVYGADNTGDDVARGRFLGAVDGWLLKTTESIPARSGTTLGSGDCIICTRSGSTIVETEDEITAYNSQNGDPIPSGVYVQAKLWQGVPLIDVVECEEDEEDGEEEEE